MTVILEESYNRHGPCPHWIQHLLSNEVTSSAAYRRLEWSRATVLRLALMTYTCWCVYSFVRYRFIYGIYISTSCVSGIVLGDGGTGGSLVHRVWLLPSTLCNEH